MIKICSKCKKSLDESQFCKNTNKKDGLNIYCKTCVNNYGTVWEIDHIIPCTSFDLSLEENQKKCFYYSNTQPLLCSDNRRKGKKLNWGKY